MNDEKKNKVLEMNEDYNGGIIVRHSNGRFTNAEIIRRAVENNTLSVKKVIATIKRYGYDSDFFYNNPRRYILLTIHKMLDMGQVKLIA
ncbi:MAG: hypothetical protein A4E71_02655 [Smithella sp. PtaU1.Bin162]|nr:MAG: hypothetical protein A4E71_02655 [Smithella sp. PtaU1.Bin162]